ncbi:MAG: MTAP family purine nucleoside phosphorylase [Candidatus Nezhaarchaeales archaeon]
MGLIVGSGVEELARRGRVVKVPTRFGSVEASLTEMGGVEAAVLPRHGLAHAIPPHRVNYRAVISALKELGATRVLATGAVGSLREHIRPGMAVVVNDFIDLTKSRPSSLYEGPRVVHADMTEPFCPELRAALLEASRRAGLEVLDGGTYACTEGPRFETPAEIRAIRILGGDVVGMTVATEAALAREAGLCYAALCLVTNMAAGIQGMVTAEEVAEVMGKVRDKVLKSLEEAVALIPVERRCSCLRRSGQRS